MQSAGRRIVGLPRRKVSILGTTTRKTCLTRFHSFTVSSPYRAPLVSASAAIMTSHTPESNAAKAENGIDVIKIESETSYEPILPDGYEQISEGQAKMMYKKSSKGQQEVFYNPVQVQNRDLSILMLSLYAERRHKRDLEKKLKKERRKIAPAEETDISSQKKEINVTISELNQNAKSDGLRILEALAASGLRSIRYSKEVPGVREIIVNDIDPAAVERAVENIAFNQVDPKIVKPQLGDATSVLYNSRDKEKQFDVIDLDPYGTAAPFLDGAVQAIKSGGLLCITCTDMRVLNGGQADLCYSRYGAMPMPNGKYLHELALRMLLQTVSTSANRYGRTIRPILCVGMAFYIRVFLEVYDDSAGAQKACLSIGNVYQSCQCPSFYTVANGTHNGRLIQPGRGPPVPACTETGAVFKIAGPIWLGPLHDLEAVNEAIARLENNSLLYPLKTHEMLHGMLSSASEELNDVPLYYLLPDLCKTIGCATPPMIKIKAALANAGFRCSGQHKEPMAVKTDAPPQVVWDIMRAWTKLTSPKDKVYEGTAGKILSTEPMIAVDFTVPPGFDKKKKVKRFPMNPEPDWGPKAKATGKRKSLSQETSATNAAEEIET